MKTISLLYKFVVILLFAGLSVNTVVAQTEKKERVEKVFDISPSGSLIIPSVFRQEIEILTWERNEVKVVGELSYEDDDNKEDVNKLLDAFGKSISAKLSKDVLNLDLKLIKSSDYRVTRSFFGINTTVTDYGTVLYNGDNISITANNIKISYTIWIPATLNVKIESRYGKLKMASIKGNVDFTLQNNNLVMGDFGESGIFNIRYSTATIGSGGVSKFNAFNGTINVVEVKNVTIDARYSKFNITKALNVSVKSFQDTFDFGMLNDIDASARYSTIRIENNAGKSKFDFFQCKFYGKNFQTMEISSARYSKFNATDIDEIKISSSFQSEFNLAKVNTFFCKQTRYDKFRFNEIGINASFQDALQPNVNINKTSASFNGFSGNFKYGSIDLKINPNVEYNLNYNGTYGSLRGVSSDKFKTKFISDNNNSKTTIQGLNAGAKCNIEIVAQNTTCKIE